MAAIPPPNLDDARACLDRAQKHYAELREITGPGALWRITEDRDGGTGDWYNRLHLDRARLVAAKPVLADCATNAWSALDHVAAAIAKANGRKREDNKRLYFPWGYTDEAFKKALAKVEPDLGNAMLGVLAEARERHQHEVHHLEAAKQISNSGKHWELAPATGNVAAVVINIPGGGQRIFNLPADAFAASDFHEYHRGQERLPNDSQTIVVSLTVAELEGGVPNSVDLILECSFRFVRGVIDAVAEAGAVQAAHTA